MIDAGMRVNSALDPAHEINRSGSHTLQKRDREQAEALRASLIEATVEALADGTDPRLAGSRSWV